MCKMNEGIIFRESTQQKNIEVEGDEIVLEWL